MAATIGKRIGYVRRGVVAIHGLHFSCHVCFPPFRIDTESPGGKTTPHQFNPVPWAGNAPGQGPHEKSLKRPAFTCVCFPQILAFLAYKVKYETYNIFPIFVKTFSFIAPSWRRAGRAPSFIRATAASLAFLSRTTPQRGLGAGTARPPVGGVIWLRRLAALFEKHYRSAAFISSSAL